MRFSTIYSSFIAFLPLFTHAQVSPAQQPAKSARPAPTVVQVSKIARSNGSDTAIFHLEMKNAQYDHAKNNLPFYLISKTTPYDQAATPSVIAKKVQVVAEPHASVMRRYMGGVLTNNFELTALTSLYRTENLNHYRLYPFRINATGQIEELIDYDLSWRINASSNNRRMASAASFTNNSVLSSGNWYKIAIAQTGIYKINKAFLNNLGINTNNVDPRKIQIYGNGGIMIPELNSATRYDDLQQNSIQVVGEEDGKFDNSDYILFYGLGVHAWSQQANSANKCRFKVKRNLYADTSYYYLTVGSNNGMRVDTVQSLTQNPDYESNAYDYYNFHEVEQVNFAKSGRDFYGEYFDINNSYGFSWSDGDFVVGDTIRSETIMACASMNTGYFFSTTGNGLNYRVKTAGINVGAYLADYASSGSKDTIGINNNPVSLGLTVTKLSNSAVGWLDKITVNARRYLNVNGKQYCFRDTRGYGTGKTHRYKFTNPLNASVTVWNVTDLIHPRRQLLSTSNGAFNFTAKADSLNEFCMAPSTDYYTPTYVGRVENQNLHAIMQADFIFVTHPLFIKEAQELAAFHQQKDGLTYAIATTEQIYNEFGSGRPDLSAIRDFIRMIYSRTISGSHPVKYVQLVGDGSYDNHTHSLVNNTDFIPTYQSLNSLSATASIATDDFFGLMDPSEGAVAEEVGTIDLGVGRLTCKSVTEARGIINKIESYYRKDPNFKIADSGPTEDDTPLGDWRNWLLFVGDDGDGSAHMEGADTLAGIIKKIAGAYNSDKIYLDAYQRYSTPGGHRYPDAAADFVKRIKKGTLIFNYTGHGGEVGLTEERIVDIPTIDAFDNFDKLPLFITATCEFSRYDDPARTSAGELCLLNAKGGAIALLTTCRIAFSLTNYTLNIEVINNLFTKLPDGKWPTLGQAIQKTKADLHQHYEYANFHLLGDPAVSLAYPPMKVFTSKINSTVADTSRRDTLSALEKVTITGFVADTNGHKLTNFNGIVYPTVFDKEQTVVCLVNDPASSISQDGIVPFQFKLQKNILYRGKAQVTNGDFSFTFIVPKDISFSPGPGRISYYATDGNIDANGYYSQIIVGGESKNVISDNAGPVINLYMNNKNFVNGGITNENPLLYANLTDSSGINTLGTSIGHDISATLESTTTNPVILNDYYEANLNSYQSGSVRYPFNSLTEGSHRLTFKAWDIQNNSSTSYIDFVVAKSAELALQHVLNYPNPFTTNTKFMFEHNQACNPLRVTIQVYTVTGKVVKTIQKLVYCDGFKPEPIEWDGRDDYGDKLGRGVYVYKLAILDIQNKKAEKIEKLVILN